MKVRNYAHQFNDCIVSLFCFGQYFFLFQLKLICKQVNILKDFYCLFHLILERFIASSGFKCQSQKRILELHKLF